MQLTPFEHDFARVEMPDSQELQWVCAFLCDVRSPDPAVQTRNNDSLQQLLQNPSAWSAVLLKIIADSLLYDCVTRHTSLIVLRQLIAATPDVELRAMLPHLEDALLVTMGDCQAVLQTAASAACAAALRRVGLNGWPSLLPKIHACCTAGVEKGYPSYVLGVARCLRIVMEDCSDAMAALCSDVTQLSALCDIVEAAMAFRPSPSNAQQGTSLVTSVLQTVVAMFTCGIVPQSEYILDFDTDDDDDGGVGSLGVVGTSPNSRGMSRSQKQMCRQYILQRVRRLVDCTVDLLRYIFDTELIGSSPSVELVVVDATTQLIGYWDRVSLYVAQALPCLLHRCGSGTTSAAIAIIDLVAELAHQELASRVVAQNLSGIVSALLVASVLDFETEAVELYGCEVDHHQPDDDRTVLALVSAKSVSMSSAAPQSDGGVDGGDITSAYERNGESEGSRRDAIAWCLNCLASSFADELVTSLIPILVSAVASSLPSADTPSGIPQQYEAILFVLSEVLDELLPHIPESVLSGFLQQCFAVISVASFSQQAPIGVFASVAYVRRQAVKCLERVTVAYITLRKQSLSEDDNDDANVSESVLDPAAVLRTLLSALGDTNKAVQLAVIRGLENIMVHALSDDGIDEDPNDDDCAASSSSSACGVPMDCSHTFNVTREDIRSVYRTVYDALSSGTCTNGRMLQVRSRMALVVFLGKTVEADCASLAVITSDRPVLASILFLFSTTIRKVVQPVGSLRHGTVAEVLVTQSAYCDVIEALSDDVHDFVPDIWTSGMQVIAHLTSSDSNCSTTFRDDLMTGAVDILSSCCDALEDAASVRKDVLVEAFRTSGIASYCFAMLQPSTTGTVEVDPSLRRALFGLLGDFIACGAAAACGLSAVSDPLMRCCATEAFCRPARADAAASEGSLELRWSSMDARSNALFCIAQLVEAALRNSNSADYAAPFYAHFPSLRGEMMATVCADVQRQLERNAVDNIHRTMKLNILYVAAAFASVEPNAFIAAPGQCTAFLINAAYFLPTAEDASETLHVLHFLGCFLLRAAAVVEGVVDEIRSSGAGKTAVAKLVSLLGKRSLRELQSDNVPLLHATSSAWQTIGRSLFGPACTAATLAASLDLTCGLTVSKKELVMLTQVLQASH